MRAEPAQRIPTVSGLRPSTPATHPNMMVGGVDGRSVCIYNKLKE